MAVASDDLGSGAPDVVQNKHDSVRSWDTDLDMDVIVNTPLVCLTISFMVTSQALNYQIVWNNRACVDFGRYFGCTGRFR